MRLLFLNTARFSFRSAGAGRNACITLPDGKDSTRTNANLPDVKSFSIVYQFFALGFLLAWLGHGLSASAQNNSAKSPSPAILLSNGLRVITRERHTSPLVAIDLWVRAGSREEATEEDGCAHFLEHILFKGTTTRSAGQADRDIENLGAELTAATGPDYAHFYTTVAAAHVGEAVNILADVVCNATLPPAEIERERGVILDELAAHDSDPTARLIDVLHQHAFSGQPYGHSPGGSPDAIRSRSRDSLAAFYTRVYRPEQCILVFVGDISTEQAQQLARLSFADWRSTQPKVKLTRLPASPPQLPTEAARSVNLGPGKSPFMPTLPTSPVEKTGAFPTELNGLAFFGPPAKDSSMAAAGQIVAEIMGDSRRYGRLVNTNASNAHIAAHYTPRLDFGLWLLTAQESELRSALPRLPMLRALIADLNAHPPTLAEVQSARGRIIGRMQAEGETNAGLAYQLGYSTIVNGDSSEMLRTRLQATTTRDVQEFIRRYLLAQPGLAAHILPAPLVPERRP